MPLVSTAWHVFGATLVFFAGFVVAVTLSQALGVRPGRAIFLYFWHTILCAVYLQYATSNAADAVGYFQRSLADGIEFSSGSVAISLVTRIFSYYLGLSFAGVFLVFNIVGYIGLIVIDSCLQGAAAGGKKWVRAFATLIVLLPSVGFWSSAIGKDAPAFMATGLALWAALDLRRRTLPMASSLLVMLLVRPHIAGLMLLSILVTVVLQKGMMLTRRVAVGATLVLSASILIPFAVNFAGLGAVTDATELAAYVEQRQSYNQTGGGSIDISGMSPPMQMFTYLLRPLPLEARGFTSLAAAVDNSVLLVLCLLGGHAVLRRLGTPLPGDRVFLWSFVISCWVVLAMTTANLGISLRQKWMFAPMLIYLLLSALAASKRQSRPAWATTQPLPALLDTSVAALPTVRRPIRTALDLA